MPQAILLPLLLWNLLSFLAMGLDKLLAVLGWSRIPEGTLLLLAFALGAPGAIAGSLLFRHKTRKPRFRLLFPLALALNILILWALWYRL